MSAFGGEADVAVTLGQVASGPPIPDMKPDQRLRLVAAIYHPQDGSRLL